jgi:hypothetical protein
MQAALLVFSSAAAGAGIVAARLFFRSDRLLHLRNRFGL